MYYQNEDSEVKLLIYKGIHHFTEKNKPTTEKWNISDTEKQNFAEV